MRAEDRAALTLLGLIAAVLLFIAGTVLVWFSPLPGMAVITASLAIGLVLATLEVF